jgi:transposase InsO family protein
MNSTLKPLLRKCVLVFFDDILVYSDTWDNHLIHVEWVLQLLTQDQWQVKLTKCSFAKQEISYLGHVISQAGVSTDPRKIDAVTSWPQPTSCKELRGFLGLAGYYRKFVKNFGVIAKPLTNLLKKHAVFVWTEEHSIAFSLLKTALSSAPVLALPDFARQFAIETDASGAGVGAVLLQDNHPLAFVSKSLGIKNRGLSAYEKEYLAILLAVDHWRSYLQHGTFLIFTDHKSLVHLNEQQLKTPWQQRVFTKLLGLQYQVVYKQGSANRAADALSRRPHPDQGLHAISVSTPQWLSDIAESYMQTPQDKQLLTELSVNTPSRHYQLTDGLIKYKGRIWLGHNVDLHTKVMASLHNSAIGGHSGFPVTYRRIKQLFAWPAMKTAIRQFVAACDICARAKPDRSRYPGLLQPLAVPAHAWQVLSLDFIEGLPKSGKYNCILVVVDKFSKFAHFLALAHPFTALKVAQLFMDSIYRLHGLPEAIISDRDRIFTSALWQELFRLSGTTLRMSTSYHPQTDGQTERVNQCLETFLRCFVSSTPRQWKKWLPLAEFWYNSSFHSSLGTSPFEVLYGRSLGLSAVDAIPVGDLQSWLANRQLMTQAIKQHLLRAQQRMKHQADRNWSDRVFAVGDMVYLKLQPYIQSSVAVRANHKLSYKYFGPFKILQRIGTVAYKLELPTSSSIHPVFHVSQLKPSVKPSILVSPSLPPDNVDVQFPIQVMARRSISRGGHDVRQALVRWSGAEPALDTWEDEVALRQRFPSAAAWGQASSHGGGNVSRAGNSSTEKTPAEPRTSRRPHKPNPKFVGHDWVA